MAHYGIGELGDTRRFSSSRRKSGSPDHDYYVESSERLGYNRACLAKFARKLIRKAHHTIRELGDEALAAPSELLRAAS